MSKKYYNRKEFKPTNNIFIECYTQDTRGGFRHVATLYHDEGSTFAKCTYQNRTWEAFDYESVLRKVINNSDLTSQEKTAALYYIDHYNERDSGLDTIAAVASLGDLFTDTPAESNDWKKRMLKAGLGDAVDIPEDWDQLTEDEKTKRLNGAIHALRS
jgi:hypothetical protein